MTTPYTNGAGPTGEGPPAPVDGSGPDMAARQQAIQAYIEQLVEAKVQAVLQARGITGGAPATGIVPVAPGGQGAPNSVGGIVAQLVAAAPAIAAAVTTTITAIMQAKVAANPLGHLEVIAQTNPRLLALYSPNPLGPDFTGIFANILTTGIRIGASGRGGAAAAPLAPAAPGASPGSSVNPPPGQPGQSVPTPPDPPKNSTSSPGLAGSISMGSDFSVLSDEQFGELLNAVRREYAGRYANAHA